MKDKVMPRVYPQSKTDLWGDRSVIPALEDIEQKAARVSCDPEFRQRYGLVTEVLIPSYS